MQESSARANASINVFRSTFDKFAGLVLFLDSLTNDQKTRFIDDQTKYEVGRVRDAEKSVAKFPDEPRYEEHLSVDRDNLKKARRRAEDRTLLNLTITAKDGIVIHQDLASPDLEEFRELITSAKRVRLTAPIAYEDNWELLLVRDSGLEIDFRSASYEKTKDTVERIRTKIRFLRPWWWWSKSYALLITLGGLLGGVSAQSFMLSRVGQTTGTAALTAVAFVAAVVFITLTALPRVRFIETPFTWRSMGWKTLGFLGAAVVSGVVGVWVAKLLS